MLLLSYTCSIFSCNIWRYFQRRSYARSSRPVNPGPKVHGTNLQLFFYFKKIVFVNLTSIKLLNHILVRKATKGFEVFISVNFSGFSSCYSECYLMTSSLRVYRNNVLPVSRVFRLRLFGPRTGPSQIYGPHSEKQFSWFFRTFSPASLSIATPT